MTIEVKTVPEISSTPIMPFLLRAAAELMDAGFTDTAIPNWNDQGLYIEDRGNVVAGLCFRKVDYKGDIWISIGYVDKKHRKKGYYRLLYERLLVEARLLGAKTVSGGVDCKNTEMMACAVALGRTADYVCYSQDVPKVKAEEKKLDSTSPS